MQTPPPQIHINFAGFFDIAVALPVPPNDQHPSGISIPSLVAIYPPRRIPHCSANLPDEFVAEVADSFDIATLSHSSTSANMREFLVSSFSSPNLPVRSSQAFLQPAWEHRKRWSGRWFESQAKYFKSRQGERNDILAPWIWFWGMVVLLFWEFSSNTTSWSCKLDFLSTLARYIHLASWGNESTVLWASGGVLGPLE